MVDGVADQGTGRRAEEKVAARINIQPTTDYPHHVVVVRVLRSLSLSTTPRDLCRCRLFALHHFRDPSWFILLTVRSRSDTVTIQIFRGLFSSGVANLVVEMNQIEDVGVKYVSYTVD